MIRARTVFARRAVAIFLAAGVVAVLAGCGPTPRPAGCVPDDAGAMSDLIRAPGAIGLQPVVSFPTPLYTDTTQTSAVVLGEGEPLYKYMVAEVQASVYDGATGRELASTGWDPAAPARVTVGREDDLVGRWLECHRIGSRIATVLTVPEFYGGAEPDASLGITEDDSLVLVVDIERGFLGMANGTPQLAQAGFPSVAVAPDGRPGITLPGEDPPKDLRIDVLRRGAGPAVKAGDSVVVHYTSVVWDSGAVFQSTWADGPPATLTATSIADDPTAGLVPGFAQALIGQTVGSQVIVVVPPEFGYPADSAPAGILPDTTLVFVFDVLGLD